LLTNLLLIYPLESLDSLDSSAAASKLSGIIYGALLENFGVQEKAEAKTLRSSKPNKRLTELRKEKKELKKARQILLRSVQRKCGL
jgi:hypothetical protein